MTGDLIDVVTDYAGFGFTAIVGPDTAVLLAMDPGGDFVTELWTLVRKGATWDDVIGVLLRGSIVALPAMGLVHREGEATTVLLRGAMTATVMTRGSAPEVMNGARVTTWTERPFENVTSIEFAGNSVGESSPIAETRLPLASGVVRAAVVRRSWAPDVLAPPTIAGAGTRTPAAVLNAPPPAAADWPATAEPALIVEPHTAIEPPNAVQAPAADMAAPADQPLGDHDHRTQPSDRPRAPRIPAERPSGRVSAVRCAVGHLNPPIAQRCRVCDVVLADDVVPIEIDQPPVGRLRLMPDGPVFPLRGRVLVGR
ncbi:MAG TPA: hypothetical protein VIC62_08145, partial [Nakamurella sp.]